MLFFFLILCILYKKKDHRLWRSSIIAHKKAINYPADSKWRNKNWNKFLCFSSVEWRTRIFNQVEGKTNFVRNATKKRYKMRAKAMMNIYLNNLCWYKRLRFDKNTQKKHERKNFELFLFQARFFVVFSSLAETMGLFIYARLCFAGLSTSAIITKQLSTTLHTHTLTALSHSRWL